MRKIVLTLLALGMIFTINAQEKKESTNGKWIPEATAGINLSQVAISNWAAGGENKLAWNFVFEGKLNYQKDKLGFKNLLKINYGRTKEGDGLNKTVQNDLLYNNRLSYKSGWIFDYYAGANLISYIAPGYDYSAAAPVEVTQFLNPADVTESFGLSYDKNKSIQTQLGFGFHQVFSKPINDADSGTDVKTETGIESITNMKLGLTEKISWTSYLRLFSGFDRLQTWDVRWDNTVTASVNSWLNVNLTFLVVYDKSQSLKTQVKEALNLGISYKLL